ncbi:hypothetical protein GZ77_18155 [Endozoicomonas montiporae]|uniref:Uncharacterized protein n=2 Tax=Endozoicomonas montiporae TaxID=1027273 RepID=A0A081N1X7_9GAMM|nr:hypothetical protein [Endozoicomonas montiporae]AMO58600.1 hypothetical protein EZMO1_4697 [Endozoicomonas montiporae CL-33]KEQ12450.1 hypothetical protein GZ77_18155 [Endozoicomonas montiporae]
MNNYKLAEITKGLNDNSSPAYGLARLLSEELVSVECGMSGRLTSTELTYIAESLKYHCRSLDLLACRLHEESEESKEASQ